MLDSNMLFMAVLLLVLSLIFYKPIVEKFESEDACNLNRLKFCTDGKFCVKDNKFTNPLNIDDNGECKKCTNSLMDGLGMPGIICKQ